MCPGSIIYFQSRKSGPRFRSPLSDAANQRERCRPASALPSRACAQQPLTVSRVNNLLTCLVAHNPALYACFCCSHLTFRVLRKNMKDAAGCFSHSRQTERTRSKKVVFRVAIIEDVRVLFLFSTSLTFEDEKDDSGV